MTYSSKVRLLAAGAAFTILAGPAFALDGNDVLAKINAALALQGGSLAADTVKVDGSTVTLTGASFKPSAGPQKLPIGTVTMEGVDEADGGYTIDKVRFPNINASKDDTTVTASDLSMSGVTVPGDVSKGTVDSLLLYDEAHIGPASLVVKGKTVFAIAETRMTTDVASDDSGLDFDLKIDKLTADLSGVDDPQSRETIDALGLTSLNGDISMNGNWTQNDGTIDVKDYSLDFDKVGKLAMSFSISGYTLDFIKAARETAKQMETNANKAEAQQASNLAMLGLLQRLTFNSADIRFEDDGLTNRALDYAGKAQNTTGPQMAQMLKAMTPLVLSQYNIPELQNMLSQAVNKYLDKPESFTVNAEPANPVPFPMIMGAAMGAPNTLPSVLGVKVSAND